MRCGHHPDFSHRVWDWLSHAHSLCEMNKTSFMYVRESMLSKIFGWLENVIWHHRKLTVAEQYLLIREARLKIDNRQLRESLVELKGEQDSERKIHRKELKEERKRTQEAKNKIEKLESEKAVHEQEIRLLTQIMEKYATREELATAELMLKKERLTTPQQQR